MTQYNAFAAPNACCPAPRNLNVFARLQAHFQLMRSRRALAALEDHLLRDVGLSRQDAQNEAKRPLWDAPSTWRT